MAYLIKVLELSSEEEEFVGASSFAEILQVLEEHKKVLHNCIVTITPYMDIVELEEIE